MDMGYEERSDGERATLSEYDFTDALSYDIGCTTDLDSSGNALQHLSAEFQNGVERIHRYVDKIRKTDGPAFRFRTDRQGVRVPVRTRLANIPPRHLITESFVSSFQLSEQVEAFLACYDEATTGLVCGIRSAHSPSGRISGELMADVANDFVASLRSRVGGAAFSLALSRQNERVERNFADAKELIAALFEAHARLNVIRLDLAYRNECTASLEQAQRDLNTFLNNRRQNKIFAKCVGYMWRMEYTIRTGYHYHVILFFDDSFRSWDGTIAAQAGNYWVHKVTKGRGRYDNCNRSKNRYKVIGIGTVHRSDAEKRAVLLHVVLQYLALADEIVRPVALKTFQPSRLPRAHSGLGRKGVPPADDVDIAAAMRRDGPLFPRLPLWAQERFEWREGRSRSRA